MKVALAQIGSTPGSFDAIVARMLDCAREAHRSGAGLVVFPTSLMAGLFPVGIGRSHAFMLDMLAAVDSFAAQTPVKALVPAYICCEDGGYVEVFLCDGANAVPLRALETRRGDDPDGPIVGDRQVSCVVDSLRVQVVTGELESFERDMRCDLLVMAVPMVFSADDMTCMGAAALKDGVMASLADQCPCWLAMVQGVGGYDDAVAPGGSYAITPGGVVAAASPLFEEDLAVFDIPLQTDSADERLPEPVIEPRPGTPVGLHIADLPNPTVDEMTLCLYDALVSGVRDYVRKSGFSDVLLGLSGGIDSALVAAIAADALGPEHVMGVLMPGPYSSASSVDDALELARRLGVATVTVPITGLFEAACPLYAEALGGPFEGLSRENLQARLRGLTLMSLANARGALVLNTSNKSEAGMGYSTLYGDTVGAYAPLCDCYKRRVYDLARVRNERGPVEVIPQSTIQKPPSAELGENQTDEASFGVTYKELDAILNMHVEEEMDAQEIADAGYEPRKVMRVLDACRKAEFKRRQEPMGPIVTTKPFFDRGWPVVLGWRDEARETCGSRRGARLSEDQADGQADGLPNGLPDGLYVLGINADDIEDILGGTAGERDVVRDALDAMVAQASNQDQMVGLASDVAFAAFMQAAGAQDPDDGPAGVDDGFPMFSKN